MDKVFVDVDIQRDFCEPDGALSVAGSPCELFRKLTAHAVARRIPILGSVDSHAWDAWEFASSGRAGPNGEKPGFPDHCVKGTEGWLKVQGTLPPRFRFVPNATGLPIEPLVHEVRTGATQGVYFEKEVYSLFANPMAEPFLKALVPQGSASPEFIVYGVATDYCIRAAALGFAQRGYRTTVLVDAIAGITAGGVTQALEEMASAGVKLARAEHLLER
jgi:nicotinamidase/pyrazinamidase